MGGILMITIVDGSTLGIGERIECYFGKQKNMLSIRAVDVNNERFNRIVAYAEYLHIENAEFLFRSNQKIVRGIYAGFLPIIPSRDQLVHHADSSYFTSTGIEIVGSKYAVCFKDLILAEGIIAKGAEIKQEQHF